MGTPAIHQCPGRGAHADPVQPIPGETPMTEKGAHSGMQDGKMGPVGLKNPKQQ